MFNRFYMFYRRGVFMLSLPTMNGIHGHRYLENESFRNEGDEIRYLVLKYPKRFWFIPKRPEV